VAQISEPGVRQILRNFRKQHMPAKARRTG
jgi:hypothetical protein